MVDSEMNDILAWIDKPLIQVQNSNLYRKYFASTQLENGIESYILFNPTKGIDLVIRLDFSVQGVHFFSQGQDMSDQFKGILPLGLEFSFSKSEVISIYGQPFDFGGGDTSIIYGITPPWIRYLVKEDQLYIHIQFDKMATKVNLITVYSVLNTFD